MSNRRPSSLRPSSLRPVGLAGLAWGALLLAEGRQLYRAVQGRDPSPGEQGALVVLGLRHAGQGLVQVLLPHRLAAGYALVDGLHAASMVAVAALQPERRRAALVSGLVAAAAGIAALRERAA